MNNNSNIIQHNFHTLNYDNIALPNIKIKTETFKKIFSRDSYVTNKETFPAIYHKQNTPTEPSRLQVTQSQPHVALQVLVSRGPLKLHRCAPSIIDESVPRDILLVNSNCVRWLPPQVMHVRAALCVWSTLPPFIQYLYLE